MKVTQEEIKPEFKPITIVLETEDEAKVVYAALQTPWAVIARDNRSWASGLANLNGQMFCGFYEIYTPRREER